MSGDAVTTGSSTATSSSTRPYRSRCDRYRSADGSGRKAPVRYLDSWPCSGSPFPSDVKGFEQDCGVVMDNGLGAGPSRYFVAREVGTECGRLRPPRRQRGPDLRSGAPSPTATTTTIPTSRRCRSASPARDQHGHGLRDHRRVHPGPLTLRPLPLLPDGGRSVPRLPGLLRRPSPRSCARPGSRIVRVFVGVTMSDFADLVEAESRGLVAAATAIVGDAHRAEEIVQEAFERCFRRWKRVSKLDRPGAWVRRVVINEAISVHRRVVERDPGGAALRRDGRVVDERRPLARARRRRGLGCGPSPASRPGQCDRTALRRRPERRRDRRDLAGHRARGEVAAPPGPDDHSGRHSRTTRTSR